MTNIERITAIQSYNLPKAVETQYGTITAIENGLLVGVQPEQLSESELQAVIDQFPNIHGEEAYAAKKLLTSRFSWFKSLRRADYDSREEFLDEKETLMAELKALFNVEDVAEIPQLVYSKNQLQFIEDAQNCGLNVNYGYSGRGMFGNICPSVTVDNLNELPTTAKWEWDNMGLSYVMYPKF